MVGKLQIGECAIGGLAWNALLAVPLRFRRLRTQRRVREGPLWHIQGGGRSRVSVFSFVKVNGRGNSDRTEEGSGKARWSKEQTQANGTYRASCYEKKEGESLEPKGSHPLAKLLRPKGMVVVPKLLRPKGVREEANAEGSRRPPSPC